MLGGGNTPKDRLLRRRKGVKNKPTRGRPATERGAYNPNPARQLGRVSDEDWTLLKEAAEASGKTFTEWAVGILLKKVKSKR